MALQSTVFELAWEAGHYPNLKKKSEWLLYNHWDPKSYYSGPGVHIILAGLGSEPKFVVTRILSRLMSHRILGNAQQHWQRAAQTWTISNSSIRVAGAVALHFWGDLEDFSSSIAAEIILQPRPSSMIRRRRRLACTALWFTAPSLPWGWKEGLERHCSSGENLPCPSMNLQAHIEGRWWSHLTELPETFTTGRTQADYFVNSLVVLTFFGGVGDADFHARSQMLLKLLPVSKSVCHGHENPASEL